MAFSTTVKGSIPLGGSAGLKLTFGEWSGSAGDTAGTIVVGGSYVIGAFFFKFDNDATDQVFPKVSTSVSGFTTTLTIQNQDNVTTGKFIVISGGS